MPSENQYFVVLCQYDIFKNELVSNIIANVDV